MAVTSTSSTDMGSVAVDALKKSIEVNEQTALKIIEGAVKESKQNTAQKTGLGTLLNISG
ncbi:hypothetical protein JHD48_08865 [Sulfurimonas sp. SAG-AH-194-I05]|nr:hypothetical protein [Sulfurimonas sp. SAG-AH-194-I05]MDF1875844.1 hypothetical protein [Sulfurimonas sp. SAG-AH-194-I05]